MSILVVGSVAYDNLETPAGKRERVLGGAATHFSTTASFFTDVALVGVVGGDFDPANIAFFQSRKIDCSGLQVIPQGKTFHWSGHYMNDINHAETLATELGVFATFDPKLQPQHCERSTVFLANIHPKLQLSVLNQTKSPRFVAMDTMNYWITTERDALQKVIERVNMLFVNETEVKQLTNETNVTRAAHKVMSWGPKAIAIKRGEHGSLLFHGDAVFIAPAFPHASVTDPTGAGDSYAGGFLGSLTRAGTFDAESFKRAAIVGSVMASFQVEDFGLDRMRRLTTPEIEGRFQKFLTLSQFNGSRLFY